MIFNRPRRRKKKGYTYRFKDLTYITTNSNSYSVKFRSGESKTNFIRLVVRTTRQKITEITYVDESENSHNAYLGSYGGWTNEMYRTVTFDKEPTGELLMFLQESATPL